MAAEVIPLTRSAPESPLVLATAEAPPSHRLLLQYAELTGLPLMCVEVRSGRVLARTDDHLLPVIPRDIVRQLADGKQPVVFKATGGLQHFMLPLPACQGTAVAAVGYVLARPGVRPKDLMVAAVERGWSQGAFDAWLENVGHAAPDLLKSHLTLAVQQSYQQTREAAIQDEFDGMVTQLEYTFEEISLLHNLTQNMHVSRAPRELAALSLERLGAVIHAETHVIWLDAGNDQPLFLYEGEPPFDQFGMARLIARFEQHDWSRPLVKNHIAGTLLGSDFPGLRNLVLLPIQEGDRRFGWLCSCNLPPDAEFGTMQASLLASVASILGTHGRNIDLYNQHEELLLCFVRALVSSLDAKDPYTRGHSERVALIARRIGSELKLPEEDLRDIYLSGLLHDIGKIGVDDSILRKPGQLTRDEFEQVKRHPIIGYNILSGLRNLRHVIPGVRHHHEAWNGKGYPDGLAGESIPLMARIMAVADSFDAMGSDRPYRKGMPLDQLDEILRKGAGEQWDPAVVRAYFAAKDSIRRICESYTPTTANWLSDEGDCSLSTDGLLAALHAIDPT